jgi:hypothetical protein
LFLKLCQGSPPDSVLAPASTKTSSGALEPCCLRPHIIWFLPYFPATQNYMFSETADHMISSLFPSKTELHVFWDRGSCMISSLLPINIHLDTCFVSGWDNYESGRTLRLRTIGFIYLFSKKTPAHF